MLIGALVTVPWQSTPNKSANLLLEALFSFLSKMQVFYWRPLFSFSGLQSVIEASVVLENSSRQLTLTGGSIQTWIHSMIVLPSVKDDYLAATGSHWVI